MMAFAIGATYFLSLLASLLLFYAVGKAIRWYWVKGFFPKNFFSDAFFSLLVGQIATVFLYTIFCSKGQTIQWAFLVPAFFILIELSNTKLTYLPKSIHYTKLLAILISSIICFLWEAVFFLNIDGFPLKIPFGDSIYYSKISHFLGVTGQENYWCMENYMVGNKEEGIALYHFYEMWLNSLISRLFGLLNLPAFLLVTQSIFYFTGFIGLLAIIEYEHRKFYLSYLIFIALILFLSAIHIRLYNDISFMKYSEIIFFNFLGHFSKKTGVYYIIAISFIHLFQKKQLLIAFYTIFSLSIMTVTALPFLAGGTILFLFICFIYNLVEKKYVKKILTFASVFIFTYIALYLLLKDNNSVMTPEYALSGFFKNSLIEWWTKIKIIVGSSIQLSILYSPFIIIFFLLKNKIKQILYIKENQLMFSFIFSTIIAGLIGWSLLIKIEDMFQLFVGTLAFINVFIIYLIVSQVKLSFPFTNRQILFYICLIGLLMYNLYGQVENQKSQYAVNRTNLKIHSGYGKLYLEKIHLLIEKKQISGFGGSLIAKVDYERSPYNMMLHIMRLGEYLGLMSNDCYTVSLNDLDLPLSNTLRAHYLSKLPFFQFASKQKQEGTFESEAKSQVQFIKKYKLSFVILSPNAQISEDMKPLIKEIITDELSGEKFLVVYNN